MSDVVIRAEGVGKQYRIGTARQAYGSLRETATQAVRRALGREARAPAAQEIWALKDVSFAVKRGEVLGVIGRNGAGKSTLLKILSRITPPTDGRIDIRGRIGTLLEVGTGFHPELTGRENIFLNGAILGMTRAEIRRKFDEIVDFSGVEKFIDTPVKRYSSGMYVRLAFAVAAHLEPEILLVDEVLAVGDAEFQKKCLGKMGDVAKGGRTVIFVSHNMAAIRDLCPRAILVHEGQLAVDAASDDAISRYLTSKPGTDRSRGQESQGIALERVEFEGVERSPYGLRLIPGQPFLCRTEFSAERIPDAIWLNLEIYSAEGICLIHLRNDFDGVSIPRRQGNTTVEIAVDRLPLVPGTYAVRVRLVYSRAGNIDALDSCEYPLQIPGVRGETAKYQSYVVVDRRWKTR
jgi:lipopolysaccharide transport system ATP-binding protein